MAKLEICIDTAHGLRAALDGGADRIELCAALSVGGLTPPPSLLDMAKASPVPVFVMIRPRDGDFVFAEPDTDQMLADIRAVHERGLAGVVLGASHADGTLDVALLQRLMAAARPLQTTLHRAFDLTLDPFAALDQAIALGFDTILTSGLAPTAPEGADLIAELVARAGGRIGIMAGAGVRPDNVQGLVQHTGVPLVHSSGTEVERHYGSDITGFGFANSAEKRVVSPETVKALKQACA